MQGALQPSHRLFTATRQRGEFPEEAGRENLQSASRPQDRVLLHLKEPPVQVEQGDKGSGHEVADTLTTRRAPL